MAQKLTAAMPEALNLDQKYTISFCALDPDTGDPVDGVTVSLAQIHAEVVTTGPAVDLNVGPFMLVPGPAS